MFCAFALAGCASGPGLRVKGNLLDQLPLEGRLDLLEAENDLFLSLNRLDDAHEAARQLRIDEEETENRLSAAKKELKKATSPDAREIAELTIQEALGQIAYIDREYDAADVEIEVAEGRLLASRARLERARCEIAKRYKIPGAEKLNMAKFDAQVKSYTDAAKRIEERSKKSRTAAETEKSKWSERRRKLAVKTGGARGSLWVE